MIQRYPITIIIASLALLGGIFPAFAAALELDFAKVADGQWWRLLTGHVTHYGTSHLFWDWIMFVGLSAACEFHIRRPMRSLAYASCLGGGLMLISATIAIACADIQTYRGLSGIDTGLFVWFAIDQIRIRFHARDWPLVLAFTIALVGLVGKSIFEAFSGGTMFVDSTTFTPLVESHLAGAAWGGVVALGLPATRYFDSNSNAAAVIVAMPVRSAGS